MINNLDKYSGPGVYRFLDTHKKIIYVGSSDNIHRRLRQHFTGKGSNVDKEAYNKTALVQIIKTNKYGDDGYGKALNIEDYFIRKEIPKYNKKGKPKDIFYKANEIEEFEKLHWIDYYKRKPFEEDKKLDISKFNIVMTAVYVIALVLIFLFK